MAGNRNHYTQERFWTGDSRFRLVTVPRHGGSAMGRVVGWLVYALQAFVFAIRWHDLNVVYASSPHPFAALAGLAAARVRHVPFVLEIRDLWPDSMISAGKLRPGSLGHRAFGYLERVLVQQADRIVCVTDGWEGHLTQLGARSSQIRVIPNGTEPEEFRTPQSRGYLRSLHQIEGFTAVFAGAHGEKDGIDLILDAARETADIKFLLVGSGPVKSRAIARAAEQNLTNVSFRDPVPKSDLAGLLRACDVGIHAVTPLAVFEHGMSPNKLFDYLAAELPVVSNAAGPLRRILDDGECGRVGGPSSLAECLKAVQSASSVDREGWSRRGQELLHQRFSRASAARSLERLLNDVGQTRRP